jgi:3-hydroxyacyl-[acyl-carrier-protein] dehydratase
MTDTPVTTLSVTEIQELIPHRYPFLLIDAIRDIHPEAGEMQGCVGIKNVTVNEPFFPGHFPGNPIMPGVLIVEAMAQTAGAFVCHIMNFKETKKTVYFMSIEEAKFRKPVRPGDQLILEVRAIQSRRLIWKFKGTARVGDTVHAEAIFTAMIAE